MNSYEILHYILSNCKPLDVIFLKFSCFLFFKKRKVVKMSRNVIILQNCHYATLSLSDDEYPGFASKYHILVAALAENREPGRNNRDITSYPIVLMSLILTKKALP